MESGINLAGNNMDLTAYRNLLETEYYLFMKQPFPSAPLLSLYHSESNSVTNQLAKKILDKRLLRCIFYRGVRSCATPDLNLFGGKKLVILLFFSGLLLLLSTFSGVTVAYATISGEVILSSPQSSPRFFDCRPDVNEEETVTLPGMTLNQSATKAITDNDNGTGMAGKAAFELVINDQGISNRPGDDLIVYEVGGNESFAMSVFDPVKGSYSSSQELHPRSTTEQNRCGQLVNTAAVDFTDFGVAEGVQVPQLFVDNLGDADIVGISTNLF